MKDNSTDILATMSEGGTKEEKLDAFIRMITSHISYTEDSLDLDYDDLKGLKDSVIRGAYMLIDGPTCSWEPVHIKNERVNATVYITSCGTDDLGVNADDDCFFCHLNIDVIEVKEGKEVEKE